MKNRTCLSLLCGVIVAVSPAGAADVREGLVSYWPLDTLAPDFLSTPDLVSGNRLEAVGFYDTSAVVAGQLGMAFQFDGDISQRYLYQVTPVDADLGLPISRSPRNSVLFWVKAKGTGQSDRNIFSQSSSTTTDPLIDFGTHSAGTDDSFDIFVRNNGTQINHARTGTPLDDQWHHIAWTDAAGLIHIYIDGQPTYTNTITHGTTPHDTTSIAATVRLSSATPYQYFFTGLIDEVAVWERVLTQEEIQQVMTNGIATPVPAFVPFINRQPQGATNLLVGDTYTLTAAAGGTRPLTYQWIKGTTPIAGANSPSLALSNLQESDSGDYTLRVDNGAGSATTLPATLTVSTSLTPNLTNGMVSYWPLNEVFGGVLTPDVVRGYDMQLINLTAADLTPGRWGNAFRFNGSNSILERVHLPTDELPIYTKHLNLTVSLWVNGPPNQQDKRVFSEASTTVNTPLFNLGTHNTAANGAVDVYIRNDANQQGGHKFSIIEPYDETWHHIVYVHRDVGGVMQASLYIDGMKDDVVLDPRRPLTANDTTIGAIRRGSDAAPNRTFFFNGMIDDVAVWGRALSAEEISLLYTTGTPVAPEVPQLLFLRRFQADLPAVAAGDSVTLRWSASRQATQFEIDQGVGNVTTNTAGGYGSVSVVVDQTKTFTLTVRRGDEVLTAQTTVAAVGNVAANWALLDNFETYAPGPLGSAYWGDLGGNSVIVDVNGNRMLDMQGTARIALLSLNELAVNEGQTRTLFARIRPQGNLAQNIRSLFGLTDRSLRFVTDATDSGGVGPSARVSNESATQLQLGARYGVGGTVDFLPPVLETNQTYNVWIDVTNAPIDVGDLFTIHIQREGDATRTTVVQDYISDRDPLGDPAAAGGAPTRPVLDKLFAGNNDVNAVLFDDFYLSKSGYNATVPCPISVAPPQLALSRSGSQITLTWSGGTLESAASLSTTPTQWAPVQGAVVPTYTVSATGTEQYYRVRQ